MVRIADDHRAAFGNQVLGGACKAELIFPGKDLGVVLNKSVVSVSHGVGGIQVHQVTGTGWANGIFEVLIANVCPLQKLACVSTSLLISGVQMCLVAIG